MIKFINTWLLSGIKYVEEKTCRKNRTRNLKQKEEVEEENSEVQFSEGYLLDY